MWRKPAAWSEENAWTTLVDSSLRVALSVEAAPKVFRRVLGHWTGCGLLMGGLGLTVGKSAMNDPSVEDCCHRNTCYFGSRMSCIYPDKQPHSSLIWSHIAPITTFQPPPTPASAKPSQATDSDSSALTTCSVKTVGMALKTRP
ncbi:hypothetical protein SKAU_G00316110 [Synaphobranchus kaupii]|uniref:Uncharacterized protein n=1 Tax=Synaphobranchus kaupii TaxID=118154 RepID=A0A9Q1ESQ8_SYNKA|nr:hypothetical protein SKAU_G00316110 [Synaphobranchus kaupii]